MYKGREYDGAWREPYWQRLFEEAGADERAKGIVDAFKQLFTMYTDDLVEWYANLYDPYIGGYYCTASGKENEGFLPDIESTLQAMGFISACGMLDHLGRDWRNGVTEEMKAGFVRFAKRMQEPNGYFYNLLKTREQIDNALSRRGRDLSWCTNILKSLGASPAYDTPSGLKGNGIDYLGNPVKGAEQSAAEGEKPTAAPPYPEYLENAETLKEYLNTVDIVGKPYSAGNLLNATYGQFKVRDEYLKGQGNDQGLCELTVEWLNSLIDPETGYWSANRNFQGTNGFFKVIVIYNAWGYAYPTIERAVDSILDGILGDEPSTGNVCEVYNLWNALISAKHNVIKCHDPETRDKILARIDETMKEKGAEAILNTYRKQSAYQMPDGAFAHTVTRCLTAHQGSIQVGLGLEEGDVDAIAKASTGIVNNICEAFGFSNIPIYSVREWEKYLSIIKNAKPVIKKNTIPLR